MSLNPGIEREKKKKQEKKKPVSQDMVKDKILNMPEVPPGLI
jgi:hypothetical protein